MLLSLFVLIISLSIGIACGSYLKMSRSLRYVVDAWEVLIQLALAKRHALHSLQQLSSSTEIHALSQETTFLTQCQGLSRREFLLKSYDLIAILEEIEQRSLHHLQAILTTIPTTHHEQLKYALEVFWAKSNLFAFAETHYNHAVDKYSQRRLQPAMHIFASCFRFLDIPNISLSY